MCRRVCALKELNDTRCDDFTTSPPNRARPQSAARMRELMKGQQDSEIWKDDGELKEKSAQRVRELEMLSPEVGADCP